MVHFTAMKHLLLHCLKCSHVMPNTVGFFTNVKKVVMKNTGVDVVRSRSADILENCEIVVDVGGVYDHDKKRYDHHQKTFDKKFPDRNIKLSSAGLVYYHYGKDIISEICNGQVKEPHLTKIYQNVYNDFIEHIDGIDNGVDIASGELNYQISTTLSSRVSYFNPRWNSDQSDTIRNEQFIKAMQLTATEFVDNVLHFYEGWLPAHEIVQKVVAGRTDVDASGEILHFSSYCPWKSHLFEIEKDENIETPIKFVLYPDGDKGLYRIQAVNVAPGKFDLRLALPEPWRGIRDDELSKVSGIDGCTFCHASGFIGGNKSFDGALQMARTALAWNDNSKRQKLSTDA